MDFSQHKFSIHDITVDPKSNVITKNNVQKRIEPQVITLLCFLVSKYDQVISRKEIIDEVWKSVIVEPEAITRTIFSLRNILGDDAKQPKFIETIPKKGYKFLVKPIVTMSPTENVNEKKRKSRTKPLFILSLFISFTALLMNYYSNNKSPERIEYQLPVTMDFGVEDNFSLHQKSQQLVYVHSFKQESNIFIKDLTNNTIEKITDDPWYKRSPVWLDKDTLLYIRCLKSNCQIVKTNSTNNDIDVLYQNKTKIYTLAYHDNQPNQLIFNERERKNHFNINRLNLLTDKVTTLQLNTVETEHFPQSFYNLVHSDNGHRLYMNEKTPTTPIIYSLNLSNNRLNKESENFQEIKHLAIGYEGQLIVSGTRNKTRGLWIYDVKSQSTKLLQGASNGEKISQSLLNTLNNKIFYSTHVNNKDLALASTTDQSHRSLSALNTQAFEYAATFSENNNILFSSNRTGYEELWLYNAADDKLKQITQIKAVKIRQPVVSHDNQYIAFIYTTQQTFLAIAKISTGKIISKTEINENLLPLSWSKNNQHLFVSERSATGKGGVYKFDVNNLTKHLISHNGGLFVEELKQGDLLLANYGKNISINHITADFNPIETLYSNKKLLKRLTPNSIVITHFDANKKLTFSAVEKNGIHRRLIQVNVDLDNKAVSLNTLMPLPDNALTYDIGTDGKTVLYGIKHASQGDIMEIQLAY